MKYEQAGRVRRTALVHRFDGHERIRIGVGKRPQRDGIHDAEDGAVGADADSEREDGGKCERRRVPELTDRIPHVAGQIPRPADAPDIFAYFADQGGIAKGSACFGDGGGSTHSRGDELVGLFLDVQLDFVSELALPAAASEIAPERARRIHGFTGVRTSRMPSSICSKFETSRSRCLRPAGVNW